MTMGIFTISSPPEAAAALADALVIEGLAACVQIIAGVRSVYRWKSELCRDDESLLVVKSAREKLPAIEEFLRARHPYEVPELIFLPIEDGSPPYLAWMRENL